MLLTQRLWALRSSALRSWASHRGGIALGSRSHPLDAESALAAVAALEHRHLGDFDLGDSGVAVRLVVRPESAHRLAARLARIDRCHALRIDVVAADEDPAICRLAHDGGPGRAGSLAVRRRIRQQSHDTALEAVALLVEHGLETRLIIRRLAPGSAGEASVRAALHAGAADVVCSGTSARLDRLRLTYHLPRRAVGRG